MLAVPASLEHSASGLCMADQELEMLAASDWVRLAVARSVAVAAGLAVLQAAFEIAVAAVGPSAERYYSSAEDPAWVVHLEGCAAAKSGEIVDESCRICASVDLPAKAVTYSARNQPVELSTRGSGARLDGRTCIRRLFPCFDSPGSSGLSRNSRREFSGSEPDSVAGDQV